MNILDAFDVDCPVPLEALHTVGLILERVYAENERLAAGKTARVLIDQGDTARAEAMIDLTPGTGDRKV